MDRALVTYFSRTGRTRRIALEIASALNADVDPITESRSRAGLLGYWRSGREAWRRQAAEIEPATLDPSIYPLVVLGTPVWAGNISSPVRAYVGSHEGSFHQAAFFCTHGGTSAQKVFTELAELCATRPIATLAVTEHQIETESYAKNLRHFVERLALASTQ